MSYKQLFQKSCFGLICLLLITFSGMGEDITSAPVPLQAGLFLKLIGFNKNISSGGNITIYIVGAAEFAAEMKKAEGKSIGTSKIDKVIEGDGVPAEKPSVIYLGSESSLDEIVAYTQKNDILSISGNPDFISKNVTLIVGISNKKPKIMLNLTTSKEEGIEWNPAILKVAATIK